MDDSYCILVSVLNEGNNSILKCAIKTKQLPPIPECTVMEPRNKEFLHNLLPLHVANCGPVIDAEPIFEIKDHTK